jgi:hypothetical protein
VYLFCLSLSHTNASIIIMVSSVILPTHTMYEGELLHLAKLMKIPNFRGVKMRDELPTKPHNHECGILNFNTLDQQGSHWVGWYKSGDDRVYFDSYAETPPMELIRYLKTYKEMQEGRPVIRQNALIVQHYQNECGSLCLYVLKELSRGVAFSEILTFLRYRYHHPSPLHVSV